MADIDGESGANGEDKPKRRPPAPKPKGQGNGSSAVTIVLAVVAIVAIGGCLFLFLQMQALQSKLGAANVPTPSGLADSETATAEEDGEGHEGEDPFDWQHDPLEVKYPLGKFTAKTADSHNAVLNLTLKLESGITSHDREIYEFALQDYEAKMHTYQKLVEEYKKENKIAATPSAGRLAGLGKRDLVRGGFVLLMHGGGAAPMEMPVPPEMPPMPRTILELRLDELQDEVREIVIDQINERTMKELDTKAGRDIFKQKIIDRVNGIIDPYNGRIVGAIISEIITV